MMKIENIMPQKAKFQSAAKIALCVGAAVLLSACMRANDRLVEQTFEPYSASERYPIFEGKGPITIEIDSARGKLQPQQVNALVTFAKQGASATVSPFTIQKPSGGGNSEKIARQIAAILTDQGIARDQIQMLKYKAGGNAPVKVTYLATFAQTKPCGTWDADMADNTHNKHSSNFGCSVQSNIAAMIADPKTIQVPAATKPVAESVRSTLNVGGSVAPVTTAAP